MNVVGPICIFFHPDCIYLQHSNKIGKNALKFKRKRGGEGEGGRRVVGEEGVGGEKAL